MNNKKTSAERNRAERRGRQAETMAANWLRLKGYRVVARRFKTKVGEIDLIVKKGKLIAFVEVKRRQDFVSAYESLVPQSLKRIERASELFFKKYSKYRECDVRFDAIFIRSDFRLKHLKDAWRRY